VIGGQMVDLVDKNQVTTYLNKVQSRMLHNMAGRFPGSFSGSAP